MFKIHSNPAAKSYHRPLLICERPSKNNTGNDRNGYYILIDCIDVPRSL